MPELVTYGPVSKRLLPSDRAAGADLMLPGVIMPGEGLGPMRIGQKRCIRVQGNAMPIAVGKMLVSAEEVDANGLKGKGMAVLHVYRDSLWTYGGRKVPNEGFLAEEVTEAEGSSMAASVGAEEVEDEDEVDAEDEHAEEEEEEEMSADALLEYCFFAALKTTCTDAELPISADKFYSHHMQPARPAKQPPLDAKKSSYKQIAKYIKHMHKSKAINVRDVKNNITILSVDRSLPAYVEFEVRGGAAASAAASSENTTKDEEVVALRTKPPVVTYVWQPNSYTKPLFEAMGCDAKSGYFTLEEAHRVLNRYVHEHAARAPAATGSGSETAADSAELSVLTWLQSVCVSDEATGGAAAALAADGFDSLRALRASSISASDLEGYGVPAERAALALAATKSEVPAWLLANGLEDAAAAALTATALAADGFDSLGAMRAAELAASDFEAAGAPADAISRLVSALTDGGAAPAAAEPVGQPQVDLDAVPIDEMLLLSLIKVAGGQKKGATFPTHMPIAELQERLIDRMTAFHKVSVEGEAPLLKKGAIKPIHIEMKRAAGHNKTHVSGLESFLISPDALAQALKIKLGCTTAVLKLPGNNVKEQEVLLQGHCVQEVVDYLRDVYAVTSQWVDLKLKK